MKIENLARIELVVIFIVIGSLFFVAGRTIVGMVVHDEIEEGMTMDKVREILGEPLDIEDMENGDIKWYYEKAEVTFRDGVVSRNR